MSRKNNSTRNRILECTWKLLEDGGAGAVRMSDIAKAARISRQALYLHFPSRADLLVATTLHLDEVHNIEDKLVESRTAKTGRARLDAWIDVWGNYIPTIHGIAKALMAMKDTDEEARLAWDGRMNAVRHGCAAAVAALVADGELAPGLTEKEAVDFLFTLQSVRTWEQLRIEFGWSQARYLDLIREVARRTLVDG